MIVRLAMALTLMLTLAAEAATTQATLLLSASTVKPGDGIMAGVRLQMEDGWHIYWRNPGGPGIPTAIKWNLPLGVTAGDILWPTPVRFVQTIDDGTSVEKIINYGYRHDVILLVPLQFAPNLQPGPLELSAEVTWLECDVSCVRGKAVVSANIAAADQTAPSADAARLDKAKAGLPRPGDGLNPRAAWEGEATSESRPLLIEWNSAIAASDPEFFPDAGENFEVLPDTEIVSGNGNRLSLRKVVKKSDGNWPNQITGVLVQKQGGVAQGYDVKLQLGAAKAGVSPTTPTTSRSAPSIPSSLLMLCYAFIGGMILNIMPCVLPVIALKILGFVSQAQASPGHVRRLGLIYAAGVLLSFLALAALVIGVKAAGKQAGWGMQFSNPQFVIFFIVLVTLVALNFFGVFEVTLSGGMMNAATGLASRHGASGAFFNGMLATLLATPCTAPFLGAALGFAFAQSAPVIVLVLLTAGLGLAMPYVVLSWHPAWLKFLPKPGVWMEKFKIAMGFPMLATAVWLSKVGPESYGERAWWLGIFLVFLAVAAWVFGEFVQRGTRFKPVALTISLLLLGIGYFWALDDKLNWRSPIETEAVAGAPLKHAPSNYTWQPWSPAAVDQARNNGRVIIVDFTAWWCGTCNATVKPALSREDVVAKLRELDAVALLADNSDTPPVVVKELARFGRAGVPLVLVYPKNGDAIVLPEPLSPLPSHYARVLLDALDKAGG